MHRIDTPGSVNGHFRAPDPATGRPGTEIGYDWLDSVQEEILAPIEAAGLTPQKGDTHQLLEAIQVLGAASAATPGDVIGPDGALAGALAIFEDSTGKVLGDSGTRLSDLAAAAWKRQRHVLQAAPGQTSFRLSGWPTPPASSSYASAEVRAQGAFVAFQTEGKTSDETAGVQTPHYRYVQPRWNPTLAGLFRTPTDITGVRIWLGFTAGPIGTRTLPTGRAVAALRFEHGVDTTWSTVTCDGGTGIQVVQTQPQWGFAADRAVAWRIELDDAGGATFYVNDVPASSVHTTSLPGGSAWLGCVAQVVTKTQSTRNCGVSTLVLEHD